MDGWRYLDFAKEMIRWIVEWASLIYSYALPYWKEIIIAFVLMWIVWKLLDVLIAWTSRRTITATVTGKERVYYPKSFKSMYLIFTDQGVFKNVDSWAFLSFDSSDVYSVLKPGSTYKFTISGYRYRWGSEYPNVIRVKTVIS